MKIVVSIHLAYTSAFHPPLSTNRTALPSDHRGHHGIAPLPAVVTLSTCTRINRAKRFFRLDLLDSTADPDKLVSLDPSERHSVQMAKRKRGPGPRLNIKGRAKKRAFTALDQFKIFASELLASSDFQAFTHIGTTLEHLSNLLSQLHQALQQPHSISKTLSRSIHDTITQANEPSRISKYFAARPARILPRPY